MTTIEFLELMKEHLAETEVSYTTNQFDVCVLEFELDDSAVQIVIEEFTSDACH